MYRSFLFCLALATAAVAGAQRPDSPPPRLDFKAAETRAFNSFSNSLDVSREGAPCLVEKATGRRVCKTMPQWRKLAARTAAERERPGGR